MVPPVLKIRRDCSKINIVCSGVERAGTDNGFNKKRRMRSVYITDDIIYAGVNDHQVDLFEGQYQVPNGMAYNSYVIKDEKIAP